MYKSLKSGKDMGGEKSTETAKIPELPPKISNYIHPLNRMFKHLLWYNQWDPLPDEIIAICSEGEKV